MGFNLTGACANGVDMPIIDNFLPNYQFKEIHKIAVAAPTDQILDAISIYDPAKDPLVRILLQVREAPARFAAQLGFRSGLAGRPMFGLADFVPLGRNWDEIAFGLVGQFWRLDFGLARMPDAEAFRTFNRAGFAKLVISFSIGRTAAGRILTTETRVYCPDAASRTRMSLYWTLIRAGSGFIRGRILAQVSKAPLAQMSSASRDKV